MANLGIKSGLLKKSHSNLAGDLHVQYFLHLCRVFLPLPCSVREQSQYVATGLSQEDTVHHLTGQGDDAQIAIYSSALDQMKHTVLY